MIALVVSACLISNPSVCREQRIPLTVDLSKARCAIDAAPQLAQWNGEHPDWRIVRWRCADAGEKDI